MKTNFTCLLATLLALITGHMSNAMATGTVGPYPPSPVIADIVLDWSAAAGSRTW